MSEVDQYHSALHDSDNRYHIYPDCHQGNNIKKRCWCDESQPDKPCEWCDERMS